MGLAYGPAALILAAAAIMAFSGVPWLALKGPVFGQRFAAICAVSASLVGLVGVADVLLGSAQTSYSIGWNLPFGHAVFAADYLTALFLIPLFLTAGAASVYSLSYWPGRTQPGARKLTLFMGLFAASMVLVVMARNGVLFLMVWEAMALCGYFLLTTEQRDRETGRVGTVYLLTTHTGTMALFALFSLIGAVTGSFDFPEAHSLSPVIPAATAILVTALIGFGGKAGLMPLHFWLPGAHANAPSHVSALMSGVMLKMGVYGLLRTVWFFTAPPVWLGWLLLVLGGWSAVNGIALAAGQRDIKRLLACSSIENIGIIFIGVGMAFVGMERGSQLLVALGLGGALIHVVNHGIFKPLLFLGSGAIIHATGSREMDKMGGLAKRMPALSYLFLVGSIAICGLPPLNGFAGELFLYMGAFTEDIAAPVPVVALVAPVLALVGGIAAITFVKLYGVVFLGSPRNPQAAAAHDPGPLMVGPMLLLAVLCVVLGMAPPLLFRLAAPVVGYYGNVSEAVLAETGGLVPLVPLMAFNVMLAIIAAVFGAAYIRRLGNAPLASGCTWGCGYLAPTSRMQYSGTSFSELAVNLLGVLVSPRRIKPALAGAALPREAAFRYTVTETTLDGILAPLFRVAGLGFSFIRKIQHGNMHIYILYIFATLFVLMVWTH